MYNINIICIVCIIYILYIIYIYNILIFDLILRALGVI